MASRVVSEDVHNLGVLIGDLTAKTEAAAALSNQIDSIIEESKSTLTGENFDKLRQNFAIYKSSLNELSNLCNYVAEEMMANNNIFNGYIDGCPDEDPVNARDHIPKYLEEIEKLKAENIALQEEIAELEKVQPTRPEWDDENQTYTEVPNEPQYSNARAKIAADKEKIKANNARIKYLKMVISYLRRLDGEIDPRTTKAMQEANNKCRLLNNKVDAINVSSVSSSDDTI